MPKRPGLIPKCILGTVKFKVRQLVLRFPFVPDSFATRSSLIQTRCLVCKMKIISSFYCPRTLFVGQVAIDSKEKLESVRHVKRYEQAPGPRVTG